MGTEESEHALHGLVRKERSLRSYQPSALSPHALRRHLRLRHLLAHLCSTSKKNEERRTKNEKEGRRRSLERHSLHNATACMVGARRVTLVWRGRNLARGDDAPQHRLARALLRRRLLASVALLEMVELPLHIVHLLPVVSVIIHRRRKQELRTSTIRSSYPPPLLSRSTCRWPWRGSGRLPAPGSGPPRTRAPTDAWSQARRRVRRWSRARRWRPGRPTKRKRPRWTSAPATMIYPAERRTW